MNERPAAHPKRSLRASIRSARAHRTGALAWDAVAELVVPEAVAEPGHTGADRPSEPDRAPAAGADRRPRRPTVIGYAALAGEPSVDDCLERAAAMGAVVLLPIATPGRPLAFGELTGPMAELAPAGAWHIREPAPTHTAAQALARLSGPLTVLVPGLAFAPDGVRLGNGGGFYDRTFGPQSDLWTRPGVSARSDVCFVGVCWEDEAGRTLPCEDWDLRVDRVVPVPVPADR